MSAGPGEESPRDFVAATIAAVCGLVTGVLEHVNLLPPSIVTWCTTLALLVVSVTRLLALAIVPLRVDSSFVYDRLHAQNLSLQLLTCTTGFSLFRLLPSIPGTTSSSLLTAKILLAVLAGGIGTLTKARVRRYCRARGGLVAAYGLTEDVDEAVEMALPGRLAADRVVRMLSHVLVTSLILATITSTAEAQERIKRKERAAQRNSPSTTASAAPSATSPPPSDEFADKKCEYNVLARIGDGVPAPVAAALFRALLNPKQDEEIEAPGVLEAGCPDTGTQRIGSLYVTPLFEWDTNLPLGMLVSDARGNAAVVFSELRAQVERLIGEGRLVRIARRVRTPLGDMQLLFIDGDGCAVALREYTRDFHILTGGALGHLMRVVDERQEIPRLLPPRTGTRRAYAFEFKRPSTQIVNVEPQDTITVTKGATASSIPISPACPAPAPFLEVAHEQEPEPETTP